MEDLDDLTPAQWSVFVAVARCGKPATVKDVQQYFLDRPTAPAHFRGYTTALTILEQTCDRGWLHREKITNRWHFWPKYPWSQSLAHHLTTVIQKLDLVEADIPLILTTVGSMFSNPGEGNSSLRLAESREDIPTSVENGEAAEL